MAVSTYFARGFLRHIYQDVTHGNTLLDRLTALNSSTIHQLETGRVIQSTSGNGRSVTFQVNASEGVTPTEMAELISRLLDLYDAAVAAGNTTDATRYGYMMGLLKPVRAFRSTFATLAR